MEVLGLIFLIILCCICLPILAGIGKILGAIAEFTIDGCAEGCGCIFVFIFIIILFGLFLGIS